jgi:uncharacterized protein (TIRG00374 family)
LWQGLFVRRKIESTIILLVGLALAFWFIRRLEWGAVLEHLRGMRIWPVALGVFLILFTLLVRSLRWRILLAPIRRVSLKELFAATSIGFGSVFIFGRAGEIVRPVILSLRERLPPSATIATILVERIFDMSAVAVIFAINLLFFEPPPGSLLDGPTLEKMHRIGVALTGLVVVGIGALTIFRLRSAWVIALIKRLGRRLPQRLLQIVVNLIEHLASGLSVLLNWRELALTLLLTIGVWVLVAASTWLIVYAFGVTLSTSATLFVLGFGLLGSLVPVPGGAAGAFHAAAAAGLIFLGVERNLAAGISIIFHLVAFGSPFLLGLYYLVRDGIGIQALREMMTTRAADPSGVNSPETS